MGEIAFSKYSYKLAKETGNGYYAMAGTEYFIPVLNFDKGEMYEWDEIHIAYNPQNKLYYWLDASGCSCNTFDESYDTLSDLTSGPYTECMLALKEWAKMERWGGCSPEDKARLVQKLRDFNSSVYGK